MKSLILTGALVGLAFLGACSSTSKTDGASMGMVNETCPYSGNKASADYTVDYKGSKVGFCCKGCQARFNKLDDAAKDALLSKAK
jgi:transposase-like protein